jgi:hypothetical protein
MGLQHISHRLNRFPLLRLLQAKLLSNQILLRSSELGLNDPVFVYPHGDSSLSLCREFKKRGFQLVHVCMDYELDLVRDHVRESDITLVIPEPAYLELREEFGPKVRKISQLANVEVPTGTRITNVRESPDVTTILGTKLGYLGALEGRVSIPFLKEIFTVHPEWHFIYFGSEKRLGLPNEHALSWRPYKDLTAIVSGLNVGLMPYDCTIPKNQHCVPLKLFDYFAQGTPVVSTPITFLKDYQDIVYVGSTPSELSAAISEALSESPDSPKKAKRIAVAREHSTNRAADLIRSILEELDAVKTPSSVDPTAK